MPRFSSSNLSGVLASIFFHSSPAPRATWPVISGLICLHLGLLIQLELLFPWRDAVGSPSPCPTGNWSKRGGNAYAWLALSGAQGANTRGSSYLRTRQYLRPYHATGRPNRPAPSQPKPTWAEVPKGCLAAYGFVRHWTTQPASAEPAETNLGRGLKRLSTGVQFCTPLDDLWARLLLHLGLLIQLERRFR